MERTKARVQSRARGKTGRIQLGFAGASYFRPLVPEIIRSYRESYPGAIDVAFVRSPLNDSEGLAVQPLVNEPMRIVLPAKHPRAGSRSLPLSALAQESLILFPRMIGPGLHDMIIASCPQGGFSLTLGQDAPQISSIIYLVSAGFNSPEHVVGGDVPIEAELIKKLRRFALSTHQRTIAHSVKINTR